MIKIIEIIKELFPILQPKWIFCRIKDIPLDVISAFYEEEEYRRRLGKTKFDIIVKDYRYKLTPKKEIFMTRRKVSIL